MMRLLIAFVLGGLVAGGLVVALRGDPAVRPIAPPSESPPEEASPAYDPPPARLEGSPEAAERLTSIEAENRDLEAEIDNLRARIEAVGLTPKDPQAFRFGIPTTAPSFDKADWPTLGSHMSRLSELMPGLMKTITEGGDVASVIGPVQKHNMPLAAFAMALAGDLGEEDMANKAYTHPAVIANLMRAALQDAGLPLTSGQEVAINALGRAYESETARGLSATVASSPALARLVAEVEAKSRFLASVRGLLTSAQDGVLFHPETQGRVGLDLLSPGLSYALRTGAHGTDRASLATALLTNLLASAGVEVEDTAPLAWVAQAWIDALPGVLEPRSPRDPDLVFPHVDDLQRQAKAQIAATERLLASGVLDAEQVKGLRENLTIVQPVVLAVPTPSDEE